MEISNLVGRVKLRYIEGEDIPSDDVISEMLQTVIDRIIIRMETTKDLPDSAGSIVVDAAMKALRLRGFEGSISESAADGGSMSNSFIDDILKEYSEELSSLKRTMNRSGIKFFK